MYVPLHTAHLHWAPHPRTPAAYNQPSDNSYACTKACSMLKGCSTPGCYFCHGRVCLQEHLFLVCELLRANLYEFQKYNRENGDEPYFTLPRLQRIAHQVCPMPCSTLWPESLTVTTMQKSVRLWASHTRSLFCETSLLANRSRYCLCHASAV